jgi:hypothetical protein
MSRPASRHFGRCSRARRIGERHGRRAPLDWMLGCARGRARCARAPTGQVHLDSEVAFAVRELASQCSSSKTLRRYRPALPRPHVAPSALSVQQQQYSPPKAAQQHGELRGAGNGRQRVSPIVPAPLPSRIPSAAGGGPCAGRGSAGPPHHVQSVSLMTPCLQPALAPLDGVQQGPAAGRAERARCLRRIAVHDCSRAPRTGHRGRHNRGPSPCIRPACGAAGEREAQVQHAGQRRAARDAGCCPWACAVPFQQEGGLRAFCCRF